MTINYFYSQCKQWSFRLSNENKMLGGLLWDALVISTVTLSGFMGKIINVILTYQIKTKTSKNTSKTQDMMPSHPSKLLPQPIELNFREKYKPVAQISIPNYADTCKFLMWCQRHPM